MGRQVRVGRIEGGAPLQLAQAPEARAKRLVHEERVPRLQGVPPEPAPGRAEGGEAQAQEAAGKIGLEHEGDGQVVVEGGALGGEGEAREAVLAGEGDGDHARTDHQEGEEHLGQGRHQGERRRGGISGHNHRLGCKLWPAFDCNAAAMFTFRHRSDMSPEIGQHFFRMVARGFLLDHHCVSGRIEPGQQNGGFDLGRGHRCAIFNRRGLRCAANHNRTAPALRLCHNFHAHQLQRIKNAAHGPLAQRGIAIEGRGYGMATHHTHHQARAGAGIAEIQHMGRLQQRAQPHALHVPASIAEPRHRGAQRFAGLTRAQNIIAFQQTGDFGGADTQQSEDQGAVRDALVSGRFETAFERAGAARGQGLRIRMGHDRSLVLFTPPSM